MTTIIILVKAAQAWWSWLKACHRNETTMKTTHPWYDFSENRSKTCFGRETMTTRDPRFILMTSTLILMTSTLRIFLLIINTQTYSYVIPTHSQFLHGSHFLRLFPLVLGISFQANYLIA